LIIRVVLAAVFLVAGFAKLADVAGSKQTYVTLRCLHASPLPLACRHLWLNWGGNRTPSRSSAWFGATGALVLLLLFVADNQAMQLRSSVVLDQQGMRVSR
jgi:uncharacterized membrane protein YphA (DoxX/SURF4 family)